MILVSHAIIGAAVARLVPNHPYLGFFLGIGSHFAVDAIPHWGYRLRSAIAGKDGMVTNMKWGRDFLFDIMKITMDIIAGVALSFIIFRPYDADNAVAVFAGICGGVLPDGFRFLYYKIKAEPFVSIEGFHNFIHAKHFVRKRYLGILSQAAIILIFVAMSIFFRKY